MEGLPRTSASRGASHQHRLAGRVTTDGGGSRTGNHPDGERAPRPARCVLANGSANGWPKLIGRGQHTATPIDPRVTSPQIRHHITTSDKGARRAAAADRESPRGRMRSRRQRESNPSPPAGAQPFHLDCGRPRHAAGRMSMQQRDGGGPPFGSESFHSANRHWQDARSVLPGRP